MGRALKPAVVGADGVWRQRLPPTAASRVPTTITFSGSDGGKAMLTGVLFGDVFLCGGQSNMQYTPHSSTSYASHMNNMSAELAAADSYGDSMRFFTAGMESVCGTPGATNSGRALPRSDCSKPWAQLQPNVSVSASNWAQNGTEEQLINGSWHNEVCGAGHACREPWARASSRSLGAQAWNTFSAICYLTGRDIHDGLGGKVPIGLISSNWGGTPVESWLPAAAIKACGRDANEQFGPLYNSMIAPFAVGPMTLTGFTWCTSTSHICCWLMRCPCCCS
jgi:sialate O-acetylesterase